MSTLKHYFSYGMSTLCGIPTITLLGSEQDWIALRSRTEEIGKLMTSSFSEYWMSKLLPVLDEFVASYTGKVNHGFWQSMVKLRHSFGSGASPYISGWIQLFFPYLKGDTLNKRLRPWHEMYFHGPNPNEIPPVVSCAPVDWSCHSTVLNLHFFAGFSGCTQDPNDGTLTPEMGWFVTHDPPKDPESRVVEIINEIEALLKGHRDEWISGTVDEMQPWHQRVVALVAEYRALKAGLLKVKWYPDEEKSQKEAAMIQEKLDELSGLFSGFEQMFLRA